MKKSYYNIIIKHPIYQIMYNTLSNSIVCFTEDEYAEIERLLNNLEDFERLYPTLFTKMKQSGFIIEDFDELDYIKLRNKLSTFENSTYHLTINPTLDCNLKCWYCSTEYKKAKHNGAMDSETVEAVKKHIKYIVETKKATHLHLDWFGGEPLMYFDDIMMPIAKEAIHLCDTNNVYFTHHITTNSVYMTEKMIHDFADIRLLSFQIPLDGNKRHHGTIKFNEDQSGTFDTIINNLNMLSEIISNVRITLRVNYDKKTLYGIEDIIPLIDANAKKHITMDFQRVWQVSCDASDYKQLEKVKKVFIKNGLNSGFWAYQPGNFNRCYSDRFHHYAINYDGNVFKCTAQDYGKDKMIGKLHSNGIISWNMKLLSELFAHSTFDNERCLKCKALPICMGPCITKNHEARKSGNPIPCVFKNAEFALESYVIEQARKRGLINE